MRYERAASPKLFIEHAEAEAAPTDVGQTISDPGKMVLRQLDGVVSGRGYPVVACIIRNILSCLLLKLDFSDHHAVLAPSSRSLATVRAHISLK